jgi:hypothetical protein
MMAGKKTKEFNITSFTLSNTKELIVCDDKNDFLGVVGTGGVMVDRDGGGWAISDVSVYHCPRYR